MAYIQISLKSNNKVSHIERKKYLKSFYGSVYDKKKGSVTKFCTSIGFKPVMDDYHTDYPIIHPAEIKSPDTYVSPEDMLYRHIWVDLSSNGVLKFVVPMGEQVHPNKKYSYSHKDICEQFVKFLNKVYPNLKVEMKIVDSFRYTVKTFVLNFIYQNLDFKDDCYTVECSSHRLLSEQEIQQIYKDMQGTTEYNWHIEQYYCETCKGYHPHAPYHIEVVYDR